MLGVLRSLGRAGYETHGYSSQADALGLYALQPSPGSGTW